jgi:hypothetical protein
MSQPLSQAAIAAVAPQADLLMRRLLELEQRLSAEEWWMLGRVVPEAGLLAEVASLLAVARAELDQMLVQFCGRLPTTPGAADDAAGEVADDAGAGGGDSGQIARQHAEAMQLLQVLAVALPPTTTFARQLGPFAERSGMPPAAVELLGIVADRVLDAQEAIQNLGQFGR